MSIIQQHVPLPTPSPKPEAEAQQAQAMPAQPAESPDLLNGATPSTDPSTEVNWEDFVAQHTSGKDYGTPAPSEDGQPPARPESEADPGLTQGAETLNKGMEAQANTPDTKQQLEALSQQLGMDLTGFSSVQDGIAAAQMAIAQQAIAPPPQSPATYQQAPQTADHQRVAQAVSETENSAFPLDLEGIHDEALAKNLKTVKEQFEAMAAKVNSLESERNQEKAQRKQQYLTTLNQRADKVVDSLSSPKYGTAQARTPVQQLAYNNLMNTATQLISQYQAYGNVPVIENVMTRALILSGDLPVTAVGGSVQQPAANRQTAVAPAAAPRSLPSIPQSPAGTSFGPNDFDKDPAFLRALRHVK